MKEKRYTLTVTERQLHLISQCVEDCHRFAAGQVLLDNTTSVIHNRKELQKWLLNLQPLVTPKLEIGSSYSWDGYGCPVPAQRNFIAETYAIYREILHRDRVINKKPNDSYSVYDNPTLRCDDGGPLPIVELVKEN